MANFNKTFLMGNLTRDPELRYSQGGTAYCKFGLAVNETTGKGDDRKQKAHFIDCTAFGRTAEVIAEHMKKGRPIFIEGRLSYSSWTTREGDKRSKLEVVVDLFQFIGDKPAAAAADEKAADYGDIPF